MKLELPGLRQMGWALAAVALGSGASLVFAQAGEGAAAKPSGQDLAVAALLKERLPRTQVSRVNCQVVDGVCEVTAGSQLFYVDKTARYLMIGRVYDMQTRQDLTAVRLLEVNPDLLVGGAAGSRREAEAAQAPRRGMNTAAAQAAPRTMSLAALPEAGGIVWGNPSGQTVTVFSDFRCGYCRALSGVLESLNVRVIERPISVLGSRDLANQVFCARARPPPRGQGCLCGRADRRHPGLRHFAARCQRTLRARERHCRNPGHRPLGRRSDRRVPPEGIPDHLAQGSALVTWLSAQQFAGFQRAAERRSRGQATIPDVRLSLAEAIALWTDIRTAFGPAKGRNLTAHELGHLRRRAWRRSSGFASLSAPAMSLDGAQAFWRLAGKLGALAARRKASPRSKVAGAAVLGLAATQMAACTTFLGSNVKGSFSCNAPGGTCAPSTVIDDQALSVIQNARPMTPAGPYFQPPARRPAPVAALAPAGRGRLAAASEGLVHRERRVLKVVFPSYVDGAGNLHEPRIVHTVADEGGWMQLSSGRPNAGDQLAGRGEATATIPASLTDTMTAPLPKADGAALVSWDVPGQAMTAPQAQGGPPDPRLVAEARARGAERRAASPVDAIKTQVQAQLARVPKTPGSAGTAQSPPPQKPAEPAAAQAAAQGAAQSQIPSAPVVTNPPAGFSGKVEE